MSGDAISDSLVMGFDRFGEPYSTPDALGNFGSPGRILVGPLSRTGPPRVWILDSGLLDYETAAPVFTPTGNFDPWKSQKDEAHTKFLRGWWGGLRNIYNYFTYQEAKDNQVKPGHFLIRREYGGGSNTDDYVTKGNGLYVNSAEQYYWIPSNAIDFDPTSGEYHDKGGIRRYNNGVKWEPAIQHFSWSDFLVNEVAVPVAGILAIAGTAGAIAGAAPAAGSSGAVVGAGVAPASTIVATELAAETAFSVAAAESVAGAAFLNETIDFVVDTGKDVVRGAVIGAIVENSAEQDVLPEFQEFEQPIDVNYGGNDLQNNLGLSNTDKNIAIASVFAIGLLMFA